jgi:hypothetical protein
MRPIVLALGAALAATACAPTEVPPPPPRAGVPAPPPQSLPVAPPPIVRPPPPVKAEPPDTCGARDLQYLVGRPKTEIPVPVNPRNRRVTCTTCPVTMDYSPQRLNIFFDQATGIVREVKCG